MSHPIHRVVAFTITGPYTLAIQFEDGAKRTIDFSPVLFGDLFGPLREQTFFQKVQLDAETHTLAWPNGADFDPATLYDWPKYVDELATRARSWQAVAM
jgi:hypothetical protein